MPPRIRNIEGILVIKTVIAKRACVGPLTKRFGSCVQY